jgi:hypothetical protein
MIMGKAMQSLLTDIEIPYDVLPDYRQGMEEVVNSAMFHL